MNTHCRFESTYCLQLHFRRDSIILFPFDFTHPKTHCILFTLSFQTDNFVDSTVTRLCARRREIMVRSLAGVGDFCLLQSVQTSYGTHPNFSKWISSIKWPGREEVKLTNNLHLVYSVRHRANFILIAVRKTVRHKSKINYTYQQTKGVSIGNDNFSCTLSYKQPPTSYSSD